MGAFRRCSSPGIAALSLQCIELRVDLLQGEQLLHGSGVHTNKYRRLAVNLHADSVRRPLPGIGDEAFYWTYGFHASNSPRPRKVVWPQISLMERVMPEKPEVGLVMRHSVSSNWPVSAIWSLIASGVVERKHKTRFYGFCAPGMRACLSREAAPRTQKRWTEFARAEEASR